MCKSEVRLVVGYCGRRSSTVKKSLKLYKNIEMKGFLASKLKLLGGQNV